MSGVNENARSGASRQFTLRLISWCCLAAVLLGVLVFGGETAERRSQTGSAMSVANRSVGLSDSRAMRPITRRARRSLEQLRAGCQGGSGSECYEIAALVLNGHLSARSETAASALLGYACDRGSMEACASLAERYEAGLGVQQRQDAARALFDLACLGGLNSACGGSALLRAADLQCAGATGTAPPRDAAAGPVS